MLCLTETEWGGAYDGYWIVEVYMGRVGEARACAVKALLPSLRYVEIFRRRFVTSVVYHTHF
jgi:hypothetical protein